MAIILIVQQVVTKPPKYPITIVLFTLFVLLLEQQILANSITPPASPVSIPNRSPTLGDFLLQNKKKIECKDKLFQLYKEVEEITKDNCNYCEKFSQQNLIEISTVLRIESSVITIGEVENILSICNQLQDAHTEGNVTMISNLKKDLLTYIWRVYRKC